MTVSTAREGVHWCVCEAGSPKCRRRVGITEGRRQGRAPRREGRPAAAAKAPRRRATELDDPRAAAAPGGWGQTDPEGNVSRSVAEAGGLDLCSVALSDRPSFRWVRKG